MSEMSWCSLIQTWNVYISWLHLSVNIMPFCHSHIAVFKFMFPNSYMTGHLCEEACACVIFGTWCARGSSAELKMYNMKEEKVLSFHLQATSLMYFKSYCAVEALMNDRSCAS